MLPANRLANLAAGRLSEERFRDVVAARLALAGRGTPGRVTRPGL